MMTLKEIFATYNIPLLNSDGELRDTIDVIEDMYLILNSQNYLDLKILISTEEPDNNVFQNFRDEIYKKKE